MHSSSSFPKFRPYDTEGAGMFRSSQGSSQGQLGGAFDRSLYASPLISSHVQGADSWQGQGSGEEFQGLRAVIPQAELSHAASFVPQAQAQAGTSLSSNNGLDWARSSQDWEQAYQGDDFEDDNEYENDENDEEGARLPQVSSANANANANQKQRPSTAGDTNTSSRKPKAKADVTFGDVQTEEFDPSSPPLVKGKGIPPEYDQEGHGNGNDTDAAATSASASNGHTNNGGHEKHHYESAEEEFHRKMHPTAHYHSHKERVSHKEFAGRMNMKRPKSSSYLGYATREFKGLRLNSSPPKLVKRVDGVTKKGRTVTEYTLPDKPKYVPVHRTRTQRRQQEKEERIRQKRWERENKPPVRMNEDGTPCYTTVSQHKQSFDNEELERQRQRQAYEHHVKMVRTDRTSMRTIRGSDGDYMYDERGFKVLVSEYKPPEQPEVKKEEKKGPFFKGDIIHKTQSHITNMRRMIKLRNERAIWEPQTLPSSTYSPAHGAMTHTYVPENLFSHDKFHADVLKYGNSHGNSASKFGGFGGNRGKKHTSVQTQQQDIPCLPLSCCRQWPENDSESLEPGDVVITIEYCHSCEEHNYKSRHNPQKYLGLAHTYREAMCKVAASYGVRLSVFLKPITIHDPYTDLKHHHDINYENVLKGMQGVTGGDSGAYTRQDVLEKVRFETMTNRIGAFEIQVKVISQFTKKHHTHLLHSKLYGGTWPARKVLLHLFQHLLEANVSPLSIRAPEELYMPSVSDVSKCDNILDLRELGTQEGSDAFWKRKNEADAKAKSDKERELLERQERERAENEARGKASRKAAKEMEEMQKQQAVQRNIKERLRDHTNATSAARKQAEHWKVKFDEPTIEEEGAFLALITAEEEEKAFGESAAEREHRREREAIECEEMADEEDYQHWIVEQIQEAADRVIEQQQHDKDVRETVAAEVQARLKAEFDVEMASTRETLEGEKRAQHEALVLEQKRAKQKEEELLLEVQKVREMQEKKDKEQQQLLVNAQKDELSKMLLQVERERRRARAAEEKMIEAQKNQEQERAHREQAQQQVLASQEREVAMAAQRREMEMQAGEKRAAALQADLQDVRYRQEQEVAKAAQRRAEDEEASESTGRLAREKLEKARTREEQAVEDQFRTSLQQESDIRLRMERIESDGEIKKGVSRDEEGVKLAEAQRLFAIAKAADGADGASSAQINLKKAELEHVTKEAKAERRRSCMLVDQERRRLTEPMELELAEIQNHAEGIKSTALSRIDDKYNVEFHAISAKLQSEQDAIIKRERAENRTATEDMEKSLNDVRSDHAMRDRDRIQMASFSSEAEDSESNNRGNKGNMGGSRGPRDVFSRSSSSSSSSSKNVAFGEYASLASTSAPAVVADSYNPDSADIRSPSSKSNSNSNSNSTTHMSQSSPIQGIIDAEQSFVRQLSSVEAQVEEVLACGASSFKRAASGLLESVVGLSSPSHSKEEKEKDQDQVEGGEGPWSLQIDSIQAHEVYSESSKLARLFESEHHTCVKVWVQGRYSDKSVKSDESSSDGGDSNESSYKSNKSNKIEKEDTAERRDLIGKTTRSGAKNEGRFVSFQESFMYALSQETFEGEGDSSAVAVGLEMYLHVEAFNESSSGLLKRLGHGSARLRDLIPLSKVIKKSGGLYRNSGYVQVDIPLQHGKIALRMLIDTDREETERMDHKHKHKHEDGDGSDKSNVKGGGTATASGEPDAKTTLAELGDLFADDDDDDDADDADGGGGSDVMGSDSMKGLMFD